MPAALRSTSTGTELSSHGSFLSRLPALRLSCSGTRVLPDVWAPSLRAAGTSDLRSMEAARHTLSRERPSHRRTSTLGTVLPLKAARLGGLALIVIGFLWFSSADGGEASEIAAPAWTMAAGFFMIAAFCIAWWLNRLFNAGEQYYRQTRKRCPDCAKPVLAQAKACRFCGHRFEHHPLPER